MRSPTSNLDATLEARVSRPGYLVSIVVSGSTLRFCSLDDGFSFDGYLWTAADLEVSAINWAPSGEQAGQIVIGDSDLVFWGYALNLQLQDAPVSIWACDGAVPDEAEPLWSGRIGTITRGDQSVTCALVVAADVELIPRRRAQTIVPSYLLMPPGTVIQIGAQQWILERQFDAARIASPSPPPGRRTRHIRVVHRRRSHG